MRLNNQKCLTLLYTLPLCRLVQWSDLSIGYILLDIGSNVCCYTDGTGRPSQLHRTSHHVINAGYRLWNICHWIFAMLKSVILKIFIFQFSKPKNQCLKDTQEGWIKLIQVYIFFQEGMSWYDPNAGKGDDSHVSD